MKVMMMVTEIYGSVTLVHHSIQNKTMTIMVGVNDAPPWQTCSKWNLNLGPNAFESYVRPLGHHGRSRGWHKRNINQFNWGKIKNIRERNCTTQEWEGEKCRARVRERERDTGWKREKMRERVVKEKGEWDEGGKERERENEIKKREKVSFIG